MIKALLTRPEPSLRMLAKDLLKREIDNFCEIICLQDEGFNAWSFTLLHITESWCMAKISYSPRKNRPFYFRFENTNLFFEDSESLSQIIRLWARNPDSFDV